MARGTAKGELKTMRKIVRFKGSRWSGPLAAGLSLCLANAPHSFAQDRDIALEGSYPVYTGNAALLCRDVIFYDVNGQEARGTMDCESTKALKPENLRAGKDVAGVKGAASFKDTISVCQSDGETGCILASESFAAVTLLGLEAKIIKGQSAAGVSGQVNLPAIGKTVSTISYGPQASPLQGTLSLPAPNLVRAGTASYGDPSSPLTPSYAPDFPSVANVLASDTVDGVSGTLIDCAVNGAVDCIANNSYKAADLSQLMAGNIKSGVSIAGQLGAYPSAAHPLSGADGTSDLVAFGLAAGTGLYEFFDSAGNRYTGTIADGGTITPGVSNQTINAASSLYRRLIVAGDSDLAALNIQTGTQLFGVTGAFTTSPSTCNSDGAASCLIDGTNYKAMVLAGAVDKILSSQTLGGVTGNVTLPAVGKVLSSTQYGVSGTGLSGTLTLPAANTVLSGSAAYGNPAAQLTPSYSPDFPLALNVRASDTVNGAAGTLDDCSAGNQSGCVTTLTYKSMNLSSAGTDTGLSSANFNATIRTAGSFEFWDAAGARHSVAADTDLTAAKILSGETIFGVTGSVTAAPANCGANGSQSCVATGSYFAATACGANGSNCFVPSYIATTQPLKAISYDAIDAGQASIHTSLTLAGIQGTLPTCATGNTVGCLTTATYKSMDLSSAGSATGLTSSNFNATLATAANFEFWDAAGARYQVAGNSSLSAANVKNGVSLFGVSGNYPSATYPLASDTAATDLTLFATQLTTDGAFEFFDSAGAKYSGSGDSDLFAAKIKNAVALENFGIAGTFTYNCPTGWIKVPGDSDYGTNDFCVMRYEAKNDGSNNAVSQAANPPWDSITQTASITNCRALGTGYDLISNAQWMTIGSNVAAINGNWTGSTVGSGSFFAGHVDNNPTQSCAASSNDSLFYVETDCTNVSSGDSAEQRRTLTLSNNAVMWDLSGNVSEWVNYINIGDKPGATAAFYEYTAVTGTTTTALKDLIPTHAVKAFWSDTWSSAKYIGQFFPGTDGSGGGLRRGGSWSNGSAGGVFGAFLNVAPSVSATAFGFRCSLAAPNP